MKTKTIYLIRHCKATGQEAEAPLTEEGERQARRLADFLADRRIDKIVSSPFRRAIRSVEPLARRIGLDIAVDDRLRERVLSGRDLPDWMERLRASFEDMDIVLEGGESSRTATERARAAIEEQLAEDEEAANIAVATHGNLMALILKCYDDRIGFEAWKALTNPDVYELEFRGGICIGLGRVWEASD